MFTAKKGHERKCASSAQCESTQISTRGGSRETGVKELMVNP